MQKGKRELIRNQVFSEGANWVIAGFLRVNKSMGSLVFTTISDVSGQIQVLFKSDKLKNISEVKKESVLLVEGVLQKRKSVNPNIEYGEWEVIASSYQILSEARSTLPFELIDKVDPSLEPTRLKYRYLDLRRGLYKNLIQKSQILHYFREYLVSQNFVDVATPALSLSSKEGANTFDVQVTRDKRDALFSLAQSPQLYKQLLMIGGIERYFQFANCFRLEDLRADRQYEFAQIDMEMAYADSEQIFNLVENAFKYVWKKFFDLDLPTPFSRLTYEEALTLYGSDKPDMRYDSKILNLTKYFPSLLARNNHSEAFGLFFPNTTIFEMEQKWMKQCVSSNPVYILTIREGKQTLAAVMNMNYPNDSVDILDNPSYADFLPSDKGTLLLVTCDEFTRKNSLITLGNMRTSIIKILPDKSKEYKFLWVIDWPLFEYNETQQDWVLSHHMFTKPLSNTVGFDRKKERSLGYDLVLNGVELASGSERINDLDLQNYMFEIAGLSKKDVEDNFGWFLEAFKYGVPPHAGIAIGIDRLIQMILRLQNIREVIAFPKNNHGVCPLTNSPKFKE